MTVNHDVVGSSPTGGAKQRPRFGEVFCLSRPASGQGGIAPPVGLNQTTSRFENVTPVALLTERKRFQDAIGTPGAPFHFRFSLGRPAQIIDVVGAWAFAMSGGTKTPPAGLNQTTSRFENVTLAAPSDQEKAFSRRHRDARRSVLFSLFARASGANH